MNDMLFWSTLSVNIILLIYLSLTAKTHAQPWRVLVLGLICWVVVFWLQDSVEMLVRLVGETKVGALKSGVALVATTTSAMVGALFSTAITNRAMHLNKKAVEKITADMSLAEEEFLKPADEIHARLTDPEQPLARGEILQLDQERRDLRRQYRTEVRRLRRELRKLVP